MKPDRKIGPNLRSEEVMRSHERRRATLDGRPHFDYPVADEDLKAYYEARELTTPAQDQVHLPVR